MKRNILLGIILPKSVADVPVRIIRRQNNKVFELDIYAEELPPVPEERMEKKYAFVWRHEDYLKVALDEIRWIEASGSYSVIHLTQGHDLTVSHNLAVIEAELPGGDFIRIHRSCIVNLKHVESMTENSLRIDGQLLPIGREYREAFLDRVIFLGTRRAKKDKRM